jgi:hypothetical protein
LRRWIDGGHGAGALCRMRGDGVGGSGRGRGGRRTWRGRRRGSAMGPALARRRTRGA